MLRTRAKWRHLMEVTMKERRQKMIREARSAPPPLPSGYPHTEEEWRQVNRYEQWLVRKSTALNEQVRYNLTEITKLNKHCEILVSCSDDERNCMQGQGTACKLM